MLFKLILDVDKSNLLINGKFLSQPITGVQRFAREILIELDNHVGDLAQNLPVILIPSNAIDVPNFKNLKLIYTGLKGSHFWEQIYLPFVSRGYKILNLAGSAPLFKLNQFMTIHDAAVFEANSAYSSIFVLWYQFLFAVQARLSRKIFTVSTFSAKRLIQALPALKNKIFITPNGHEHILRIKSDDDFLRSYGLKYKSYYFLLGSFNPNKNIKIILEIAKNLKNSDIIFVITGGINSESFAKVCNSMPTSKNIRYLGQVDDSKLKSLYLNAKCLIFPSVYEGFGIPVLEALALGTNVIASDIPAIREVGEDLISYFQADKPDQLLKLIVDYENGKIKDINPEDAKNTLAKFSWRKSSGLLWVAVNENN